MHLLFQHRRRWHSWLCFNVILLGSFRYNMPFLLLLFFFFTIKRFTFLNINMSANCQSTNIHWATSGYIIRIFNRNLHKNVHFSINRCKFTYWFKPASPNRSAFFICTYVDVYLKLLHHLWIMSPQFSACPWDLFIVLIIVLHVQPY